MARSNTGFCPRAENRRQRLFDALLGLVAALAIVHVALFQLIDGMRIPHCFRAASLEALLAPCAPAARETSQRAAISSMRAASSSHNSPIAQ